ncbi:hypothetical protein C4J81_15265 [Deltaproteobacteria bacterium Smac51]|nr:hypothetical protein C4J81_15265 [Deltaproteobacteria bacterium Smac51]
MTRDWSALLKVLLIVLLLPANAYALKEQECISSFNKDIETSKYAFPGLELPQNTQVYAVWSYARFVGGLHLGWQLEGARGEATILKVVVDSPNEPVVLMLRGTEPHIWHINWTKGTQIKAVFASGGDVQRVAGLPDDVPVLNSTYESRRACGNFYLETFSDTSGGCLALPDTFQNYSEADILSRQLFGRKVSAYFDNYHMRSGQLVIGEAGSSKTELRPVIELRDDAELITNAELRKEDFHAPSAPMTGDIGLPEAEDKSLIRKATEEDIQEYLKALAKTNGLPDRIIPQKLTIDYGPSLSSYVVLSPHFKIPDGLRGSPPTFLLPEGLPQPECPGYCLVYSLAEARSPIEARGNKSFVCHIGDLKLPPELKVYAAGASSASKLNIQLDDRSGMAALMKATVNSPRESVALMLGGSSSTIWHLSWTEGTKISAVVTNGSLVVGLPNDVPILNISDYQEDQCPRFGISPSLKGLVAANDLSNHLFKRDIEQVYPDHGGKVVIGKPLQKIKVNTSEEFEVEKLTAPEKLLPRQIINRGLEQGIIRRPSEEDIQKYSITLAKAAGLPNLIAEELIHGPGDLSEAAKDLYNTYVVISPDFRAPNELYGDLSPAFIFPESIPQPKDRGAYFTFQSFAEVKVKDKTRPKPISDACGLRDLKLPPNLKVYAAGAFTGSDLNIKIDREYGDASLMQITVNSPQEPVALLLGATRAQVWHLNWTEGTRISAVIVDGLSRQQIVGLPEDVPVLNIRDNTDLCPGFYGWFYTNRSLAVFQTINGLANHLFKKDIDRVYYVQNGQAVIGKPFSTNMKLLTGEELNIEKISDSYALLPGKEGILQAENRGLIRKASNDDYEKWLEKYAYRQNILAGKINERIKSGSLCYECPPYNAYVVLSPDFLLPVDLYGENAVDFIVPEDIPIPQRSRSRRSTPTFYLLKDGTCVGPNPGCFHGHP